MSTGGKSLEEEKKEREKKRVTDWMTISPQKTPTGGSPNDRKRFPHHNISLPGNEYAHFHLVKKGKKQNEYKRSSNQTISCFLILLFLTIDHHVVSNDSGSVESSLSGPSGWKTGTEGCPKPPVQVENVGVVDPHAEP